MAYEVNRAVRLLVSQVKTLKRMIDSSLADSSVQNHSRYVSFKAYARQYNLLAEEAEKILGLPEKSFSYYQINKMTGSMDTVWPVQKEIMESVCLQTGMLLTYLEDATDFAEDEFDNIENFIKCSLRAAMFSTPQKEVEVQNTIETLFVGKGMTKGIDYDRESGKFEFSGKEYIPDFVIPKLGLCVEVKLLRDGKKSRVVEEINADITAYKKKYNRQLFVVYDLGVIRDELEFRRDIENAGEGIKVVLIKH